MVAASSPLDEIIGGYFDLADIPPVDQWAERNVYLPLGEKRGFIDLDETPWAREPINSLTDPEVQIEAGVYGAQLAKTTQATIVALANAVLLRQTCVWMWPKEGLARDFSTSRFQPVANASPAIRAQKPDNHDLFKNLHLQFKHGAVKFVGSHSRVDQKSTPAPVTIVDEIENIAAATEKETDPITSLEERSKTYTDRKMFLFGSCLLENGPAWQQYLRGDQRHYLLPCPDCQTPQSLEFRGPVWIRNLKKGGELESVGRSGDFRLWWDPAARIDEHNWDFEAVRATACYTCPVCAAKIRDEHKRPMLKGGLWVPTTRAKVYGHRSRRINSLYPVWAATSYAAFAIKFLSSTGSSALLQNFTNNWEAKPWTSGLDISDKDAVAKRLGYLLGDHARGARTGAHTLLLVDVQRTHLVWALFGFDAGGNVSLSDCNYTRDFDSLRELDDQLKPNFVAIDGRYRSQEVYAAVHERRNRWIALRGEEKGAPLKPNYNFDPFTGDRAGRQGMFVITLVHLNTYSWGEEFLNRLYPAKQTLVSFPAARSVVNEIPAHLAKYVAQLKNAGGAVSIAHFDDDWQPIGPRLREQMIEAALAVETDGQLALAAPAAAGAAAGPTPSAEDLEQPRIRDFTVFGDMAKSAPDFVRQLFSTFLIEYIDPKGRPKSKWKESKEDHLFDLCKYAYAIGSMLGFTKIASDARRALAAATDAAGKQPQLELEPAEGGTPLFRQP